MKLDKLLDNKICQIYSISEPSKAFKAKYPSKFIIIYLSGTNDIFIDNTDELDVSEIMSNDGCVYIFTYHKTVPNRILSAIVAFSKNVKIYTAQGSNVACLDQYYIKEATNMKSQPQVVMAVYPRNKIVPPLFNRPVIIRANIKKLQLDNIAEQVCEIVNQTILAKSQNSDNFTVEDWVNDFIIHPFATAYGACVVYPKHISDNTVTKLMHCKPLDINILYDVRAKSYAEELKVFTILGEAFNGKNMYVTVYDTYNNTLDKIKRQLDAQNLHYTEPNQYSIVTKYENMKAINVKYALNDFL